MNVLIVVADTARMDDAYSRDPLVMPTLLELGEEGHRFEQAFASAPWTLPSHAGLFTGVYSSRHGAHGGHPYLDDDHLTLAEAFEQSGFETLAASNNTWISGEFGFDRGFSTFWRGWQYVQSADDVGSFLHELGPAQRAKAALKSLVDGNPIVNVLNALYTHRHRSRGDYGGQRTTDRLISWLETRNRDAPFFAFVNYLEPHIVYAPPAEYATPFLPSGSSYREARALRQEPRAYDVGEYELTDHELAMLRGLYRGELAYVDAQLARIRETLQATGQWEETLVVVLGDHGENIGDHGFLGHQYNIYDTLIHVPLVVAGGPFHGGKRVDDLVQLIDIAPTVLDATGTEAPEFREQIQGKSFHPDHTSTREYVVSEYMAPQPPVETLAERYGPLPGFVNNFDRGLRTMRTMDEKLIIGTDGHIEFYDIRADPAEANECSAKAEERVRQLQDVLENWLAGFDEPQKQGAVNISDETQDRLAQLGYM